MSIKKVKPVTNFIKKLARKILSKELAQMEVCHELEKRDMREEFGRCMQLLYSPTISILKSNPFPEERTITYTATFVVPQNLRISTPKAEIAVSRELIERCPNEELLFTKDLIEKLFEDIKSRAKYITN